MIYSWAENNDVGELSERFLPVTDEDLSSMIDVVRRGKQWQTDSGLYNRKQGKTQARQARYGTGNINNSYVLD